ncbi:MAG: hypothetical protein AAGF26_11200 [Cyanobacteria bacterium P01_G01_bin.49]
MNIITPTSLTPGQTVKVFDPDEPPTEWVDFTIIQVQKQRVELLSPNKEKTWANLDDLFIEQSQHDTHNEP